LKKRREGIAETAPEAAPVEKAIPGSAITKVLFGTQDASSMTRGYEGESEGLTKMSHREHLLRDIVTGS
jgi:hypothetical protein